ncbi:MAG: hypothetical protein IJS88_06545 [Alphaproteobacteria bacterium]|nr:hypothetical protein [Alphaproteobacteria bacterium]
MKFLHYLVILPLFGVALWAIFGAETVTETNGIRFPFGPEDGFKTQYVLTVFLIFGYFTGRIGAWFGYSPLRRDLRVQKKTNKALNKEQIKLNETVTGLKQDIIGMQAKVQQTPNTNKEIKHWWEIFKKPSKKGNS